MSHFCHWWNFNWGGGGPLSPSPWLRLCSKWGKQKNARKFSARFLAFSNEISTVQKIVLSSSWGLGNFRGFEASRPRPRTWPSRPRPRTSKCVLEAKDVLENSTSASNHYTPAVHSAPQSQINQWTKWPIAQGPAPFRSLQGHAPNTRKSSPFHTRRPFIFYFLEAHVFLPLKFGAPSILKR